MSKSAAFFFLPSIFVFFSVGTYSDKHGFGNYAVSLFFCKTYLDMLKISFYDIFIKQYPFKLRFKNNTHVVKQGKAEDTVTFSLFLSLKKRQKFTHGFEIVHAISQECVIVLFLIGAAFTKPTQSVCKCTRVSTCIFKKNCLSEYVRICKMCNVIDQMH